MEDELGTFEFPLTAIHDPKSYPLAGKREDKLQTNVALRGLTVGDGSFTLIAGPCAVESYEQFSKIAHFLKSVGLKAIRGGAYKPRTSPHSFQGLQEEGLKIIAQVKEETGLNIVTELMSIADTEKVLDVADVIQIGSRNMQNFPLLKFIGTTQKPVLLKRGFGNSIYELLMSAEYILAGGNDKVILCERGIRTFDPAQRNTLDLMAVAIVKRVSHLPILVDPSHSLGLTEYIESALKSALAIGADGALVEVHPEPTSALSDGKQSLTIEDFSEILGKLRQLSQAFSRELT